ncbi:MAG: T9SS type A sorting domain-containing protein [bacterium]|nr:T9SS type A sorting domain-containing protein [bacterium]
MSRQLLTLGVLLGLAGSAGWAAPQPAIPFDGSMPMTVTAKGAAPAIDAFGDPGDFGAAAAAAVDYILAMQADITEDNAGNGDPDGDPDDGGWDWYQTDFFHSSAISARNLYGVTANGILRSYLNDPRPEWFTAMQDAADGMVARGPADVRSGPDVCFLVDFAALPGVANPATYQAAAVAIWNWRMATHGSPTGLAEAIRNHHAGYGYTNGVIPWDVAPWVKAAMKLDGLYPMAGYDVAAAQIAQVLWQDSFDGAPGYYEPFGDNQGYDPSWANVDFYYYALGLTGLIDAFCASGTHLDELPALETALLDCQYPGGAFSHQWGAQGDDEDWQTTGYALGSLASCLSGNEAAINAGSYWLAGEQHSSGAFVYDDDTHYPHIAGECAAGMSWSLPYTVTQTPAWQHIAENDDPPYVDEAIVHYALEGGAEPFRSVTVFIAYDDAVLTPVALTFDPLWVPDYASIMYNLGTNPIEATLAILGPTGGITGPLDLFDLHFDGISDGVDDIATLVHISQVVMRSPVNQPIYAAGGDDAIIVVDDLAPTLVVSHPTEDCLNAGFWVTLDAEDNVNLNRIDYEFNNDGIKHPAVPPDFPADSFFDVFFVDISLLGEGDHTISWDVWDDVGYSFTTDTWTFHKDTQAPTGPTNLLAMPGDHEVHLTWTAGSNLDTYELWRAKRGSDYPYPGGRPPATATPWPAGYTLVDDDINAGATSFFDVFPADTYADRGIYDYLLVAVDCVNAPALSNQASATNYFLGDWADPAGYSEPYDGFVCIYDLNFLGTEYGNASAPANEEMDVAPTHDWSRFGLPGPDGLLNFEDLIVLAMNYRGGCSTPLLQIRREGDAGGRGLDAAGALTLAGHGAERQLLLDGALLGLTADLATDAELLAATSTHGTVLFYRTATGWTVDVVGLADLLSSDTVVSLRFAEGAQVSLAGAEGRDEANQILPLAGATNAPPVQPAVFALEQNHPNPFNPTTTIRYSLAADGAARLAIYNSLGQQVVLLQDGPQSAGVHELSFDGSALASGLYIYRLEADGRVAQQKMILVK